MEGLNGTFLTVGWQGLFLLLWQCLDKGNLSAGVLLGDLQRAETDRPTIIQLATPSSAHNYCGEDQLNQVKVIFFSKLVAGRSLLSLPFLTPF